MKTKIFKSLLKVAAVMAVCVTLFSCEKDVVLTSYLGDFTTLEVDKSTLIFKTGEFSKEINVASQEEWTYRLDENWVHVFRDNNGNKLTVQVDENRTKETREALLTVYSLSKDQDKKTVKISQLTSLATVQCSESELNFAAYEGAVNTISIEANAEWRIKKIPEWLRPSVSGGKGNKSVTFTTLSSNKNSVDRTATVVIGSDDDEVVVQVRQYGGAMSNCQVTPKNITVLSNGIAFDMDYSNANKVAHYYRGYMEASRVGIMTNQEIISTLQREFQRHLPSDDEVADFSDLRPGTKYIIYTLAYDIDGKRGDLMATEVWTRKDGENEPLAWIEDRGYTDSYWEWQIKKSGTCFSFYMMTTEGKDIAVASDVLQAWWLEEAVRQNKTTEYFNGGDWRQRRGGNVFAVWTRGKKSDGALAGTIRWFGREVSSSSAKGYCASPRKLTKRNVAGDHSGRKLSPGQYRLYIIK